MSCTILAAEGLGIDEDDWTGQNLNEVAKSERSSQHGAGHFPTQRYSKPTVPRTKNSNCSGQSWVLFWLPPRLLWGLFLLFSPPSLSEWWRLIVQSEKAKPVRAFSSLISQVQSSSLWAGNYIWSEKEWPLAVERSNRRPFQRLTTGQRLVNTAIFQPATFTLCHVTRQMHWISWLCITSQCFNVYYTLSSSCACCVTGEKLLTDTKHNLCRSNSSFAGLSSVESVWNQSVINHQLYCVT